MRASVVGAFAAVGAMIAALAMSVPAQAAAALTTTFSTPGTFSYPVPAGICQVEAVAVGATGGSSTDAGVGSKAGLPKSSPSNAAAAPDWPTFGGGVHAAQGPGTGVGGAGGSAAATLPVTPGETLTVTVGGPGDDYGDMGTAGPPDGGAGGAGVALDGAGGGGSSDVRQGGTGLADRVLVGGGGGGGGFLEDLAPPEFADGGAGGGSTGDKGDPQEPTDLTSGGGATQTMGGAAGTSTDPGSVDGNPGSFGQGGAGSSNFFGGSGGGGGYYGGGGGASISLVPEAPFAAGSPGGGGSGFGPPGTVFQTGVNAAGPGSVSITADPANSGCVAAAATARFTG